MESSEVWALFDAQGTRAGNSTYLSEHDAWSARARFIARHFQGERPDLSYNWLQGLRPQKLR